MGCPGMEQRRPAGQKMPYCRPGLSLRSGEMMPDCMPVAPVEADLALNECNLVWLDMEMSGLRPEADPSLEIAIEGPALALHQSDEVLEGMDSWNQKMHGRSGLIERVRASALNEQDAA